MVRLMFFEYDRYIGYRIVHETLTYTLVNLFNMGYRVSYVNKKDVCLISNCVDGYRMIVETV